MRSSPLLLLAVVALGLALLALPLARLTGASGAQRPAPAPSASAQADAGLAPVATLLRLRFAHPPTRLVVTQNGSELATVNMPTGGHVEARLALVLPPEGIELSIDASWPAGTPTTALGVELEPDGYEARTATLWTDEAALSEIVPFVWK